MFLEIKGSSDIGLEFEGLVLDPFINKGFTFARLLAKVEQQLLKTSNVDSVLKICCIVYFKSICPAN